MGAPMRHLKKQRRWLPLVCHMLGLVTSGLGKAAYAKFIFIDKTHPKAFKGTREREISQEGEGCGEWLFHYGH